MTIVGLLFCSAGKGISREIGSEPTWIRNLTLPRRAPERADIQPQTTPFGRTMLDSCRSLTKIFLKIIGPWQFLEQKEVYKIWSKFFKIRPSGCVCATYHSCSIKKNTRHSKKVNQLIVDCCTRSFHINYYAIVKPFFTRRNIPCSTYSTWDIYVIVHVAK